MIVHFEYFSEPDLLENIKRTKLMPDFCQFFVCQSIDNLAII